MIPETPNPDQMHFHEQTNTFDLTAILSNEKLTITLKDYVDWTIYHQEYTESNQTKEIHRKMELFDVYTAFSQTQLQCDEENMKKKQDQVKKQKQYEFGTIVENNNLPCYKIEREGKISTFLTINDVRINKQYVYESKLRLPKLRAMTEAEISKEKSAREKNAVFYELIKQIENYKNQKEGLLKRIIDIEQENQTLKQELSINKLQFANKIDELEIKIYSKLQAQTQNIKLELRQLKQELRQKNQLLEERPIQLTKREIQLQSRITDNLELKIMQANQQIELKFRQELDEKFNQTNQYLLQKNQMLQQKFTQLMQQFEVQNQRSLDEFFGQLQKQLKPTYQEQKRVMSILHSLPQANNRYFEIDGLKLEYISDTQRTQYIFNHSITPNQQIKFKLKITQTATRNIGIGIVDYIKQKDHRYSYSSGNAMCYYGDDCKKYPQKMKEGEGFKQDDIVEVEVNRFTKTVRYTVNGIVQASQRNDMLGDNTRVFMAFVELHDTNDSVQWLP